MADREQLEQELGEYFDETEPSWWRQRWPAREMVSPREEGPMPPALWRQPYYPDEPPARGLMPWTEPPVEPPQLLRDARTGALRAYLESPTPRWRGVIPGLVTGQYFEESEPSEATPVGVGYLRAKKMLGGYYLRGAPGEDVPSNPPLYDMIVSAYSNRPKMVYVSNLFGSREGPSDTKGAGLRAGLQWGREDVFPFIKGLGAKIMRFQPEESTGAAARFGVDPRVRLYEMAARAKARRLPPRPGRGAEYEIPLP
jgi:hypothetical protein